MSPSTPRLRYPEVGKDNDQVVASGWDQAKIGAYATIARRTGDDLWHFPGPFGLEARALTEKAPDERAIEIVLRGAVDYSTGAIAELQSVSALLESGKSRRMPV